MYCPHLATLCLCRTSLNHSIASPAELLNSRVYQANLLSVSGSGLSLFADGDVNTRLQAQQHQHKSQYNRSKPLPTIHPDACTQPIQSQGGTWYCHVQHASPLFIYGTMANGSTLRRNCSHVRPTGEKICIQSNNPGNESPTPLNEVCSTTPSTLPNEFPYVWTDHTGLWSTCQYTTVGSSSSRSPTPQILKACQAPW